MPPGVRSKLPRGSPMAIVVQREQKTDKTDKTPTPAEPVQASKSELRGKSYAEQ